MYREETRDPTPEGHGNHVVDDVDILRKPIENAAHRRNVKECCARRTHYIEQELVVHQLGAGERAQKQPQRREKHRNRCNRRRVFMFTPTGSSNTCATRALFHAVAQSTQAITFILTN